MGQIIKRQDNEDCVAVHCLARSPVRPSHGYVDQSKFPPIRCKHLRDISYKNRVIADLVQNFVAMATGVGCGRIWLASFNSPTPKTPVIVTLLL